MSVINTLLINKLCPNAPAEEDKHQANGFSQRGNTEKFKFLLMDNKLSISNIYNAT